MSLVATQVFGIITACAAIGQAITLTAANALNKVDDDAAKVSRMALGILASLTAVAVTVGIFFTATFFASFSGFTLLAPILIGLGCVAISLPIQVQIFKWSNFI